MTSIDLKKRDLRRLETRLVKTEELRKQMQKCWDLLEHDYAEDTLKIQNLKSEIYCAQVKELRGNDKTN